MSFSKYPAYKDSGVDWVGEVPEHWSQVPFFSQFTERRHSNRGMLEENLLSLSYGRIVPRDIESLDGLLPESYETYQIVFPDDLVFRLTDLQNDKRSLRSARVLSKGIITSAYLAVHGESMDPGFSEFLFRAYDTAKVFYALGGGLRQSMKFGDMKWVPVLKPPRVEQGTIAAFLKFETARMDALIAEQQRLIELLKEKRQAVISQAVTKGLDPSVPMKDSGAEWMGDVPEHWQVLPLKHVIARTESGTSVNASDVPIEIGQVGVLKTSCVYNGVFDWKEHKTVLDAELHRVSCPAKVGALIVSRMNTPNLVGAAGIVNETADNIYLPDRLWQVHLRAAFDSRYVHHAMNSVHYRAQVKTSASGASSTMQTIGQEDFGAILIASPPEYTEQSRIADHLDVEVSTIDTMTQEAAFTTGLLLERRAALVSAAVTGKIDVRNWQPPSIDTAPTAQELVTHG